MPEKLLRSLEESSARLPERLSRLLADANAGFAILDAKTDRILFASDSTCRMIGYSRREIVRSRLTLKAITHPDDISLNMDKHRRMLAGTLSQYTSRTRYIRKDKSVVQGVVTQKLLGRIDDGACLAIGIFHDLGASLTYLRSARPFAVYEDYLRKHSTRTVSVPELAKAAGVSQRTLYRDFLDAGFAYPSQYIKQMRLERVRESLLGCSGDETVIAIGLRFGFHSAGHLAKDYRRVFGELPSATLRRGRNAARVKT